MHLDTGSTCRSHPSSKGELHVARGEEPRPPLTSKVLGKVSRSLIPIFSPALRAEFRGTADFSIL